MQPSNEIKEATLVMFRRYNGMLQDLKDEKSLRLTLMGLHAISHSDEMPIDKMSRWLGFVQGYLWAKDLIDINEERELSRKLFHNAYIKEGIPIPESIDVVKANNESYLDSL